MDEMESEVELGGRELRRAAAQSMLRLFLGLAVFMAAVFAVSWLFHDELAHFGTWFVERFGVLGMATGAFLADGLHVPLPPQFYIFAGVAGGCRHDVAIATVLVGSVLGGLASFALGRFASRSELIQRHARAPRRLIVGLLAKRGYRGLLLAGVLPLSYWLLCSTAGLLRLPYRAYAMLAIIRVPRLVLSYALVALAWEGSAGQ